MPRHKKHNAVPVRMNPEMQLQIKALAKEEHISVNHFVSLALAEKLSRLEHEAWLKGNAVKAVGRAALG